MGERRVPIPPALIAEKRCGAPSARGVCRRPAGEGTSHPGSGYCFWHDVNTIKVSGRRGYRSFEIRDKAFKRRVRELLKDPQLLDLSSEIAFTRALLERIERGDEDLGGYPRPLVFNMLLQTIGRLIERKHRIEMERKGLVKIQFVLTLIDAWSQALNELIPDPMLDRELVRE